MGYAMVIGHCASCESVMGFNPHRVPSVRVHGVREPVCRACIERANPERIKNGLEPFSIPDGAYEAIDEGEL